MDKASICTKENFKNLFDEFYSSLCLFANSIVYNMAVSEDIVHDIFLKLWEKQRDFNSEKSIKSFLYTSVKNKCLNHIEHHKVTQKYYEFNQQELQNDVGMNNKIIEEETHRLINNAINNLPSQCGKILMLSINGVKNVEIAEELNISINTVKTQKKLAYQQLKIKLKDIYPIAWFLIATNF